MKKPSKTAAKTAAKPPKDAKPPTRDEILDAMIAGAAAKYGRPVVQRAQTTVASYLLRRPTGITGLDIALAGGWPASAPCVLVGPDGSGKDYLLWRTAAEVQKIYKEDFCMAVYFTEFKPDKLFMKDLCGFQIAFSEDEIEELNLARVVAGKPELSPEELDHYRHQVGNFIAITGLSADHGFDEIFAFLEQNVCQIVAVNSIGFLQTEMKERVESFAEHAQQRNEASLLSRVMPKISMLLNQGGPRGEPNETSIILVNQVRSKEAVRTMPGRPAMDRDKYQAASGAWALKHGKAIELMIHNGARITDKGADEEGSKGGGVQLGRVKQWEIMKGKLGTHEGIRGEFKFFFEYGVDIEADLLSTASGLGVLTTKGSWISYEDGPHRINAQGAPNALIQLRGNDDLIKHLREACFHAAGVPYRHL